MKDLAFQLRVRGDRVELAVEELGIRVEAPDFTGAAQQCAALLKVPTLDVVLAVHAQLAVPN